jgi:hypothetical protein
MEDAPPIQSSLVSRNTVLRIRSTLPFKKKCHLWRVCVTLMLPTGAVQFIFSRRRRFPENESKQGYAAGEKYISHRCAIIWAKLSNSRLPRKSRKDELDMWVV